MDKFTKLTENHLKKHLFTLIYRQPLFDKISKKYAKKG